VKYRVYQSNTEYMTSDSDEFDSFEECAAFIIAKMLTGERISKVESFKELQISDFIAVKKAPQVQEGKGDL